MEEINNFVSLSKEFKERKRITISKEICYSPKFKFGSLIKEMKKKVPFDFQRIKDDCNTVVLFSKIKVDTGAIDVELYFFEKKLVFFRYIFPDTMKVSEIESAIKEKYLDENSNVSLNEYCLEDSFNNFLIFEKKDRSKLSVSYFTTNYGFCSCVEENSKGIDVNGKSWSAQLL